MWQFWCNVIWKFVENLFTYQKAPFEKFCNLRFSYKLRYHEIVFAELLHVSCMGWEVKIDISGQSNDCLRVCNVKLKNFLLRWKQGTFPRIFGFWGCSVEWFELIFSKMLKLEKKESLDPKMSDFEWLTLILPTKIFDFSTCHQTAQKCHFIPLSIPCQQSQNCTQPFPAVQPAKHIKSDV